MIRDIHDEIHVTIGMVDAAAIVPVAVGYKQIAHFENNVVPGGLFEGGLGDTHVRGLAFHHGNGPSVGSVNDDIRPLGELVQNERLLHRDQRSRAMEILHQMVEEVLAHPLLRGEEHPLAADGIEDPFTIGIVPKFDAVVGQVQNGQVVHVHRTKVRTKEDIVSNWLPRYTGLPLEAFKRHVLLTNFDNYLDIFCQLTGATQPVKDKAMKVAVAEDMVMINFGMGSPNAATMMDLLSAVKPEAVLFLGKCGGLKKKNALGDLVLPIAAIRGEGTSLDYFPAELPALPSFMIHRAVSGVIRDMELDYWSGSVYTTNRRVWEHDDAFKERLRLLRAMAIDMETATLFMTGFANEIPTGALLLVSDQPMVPEGVKTSASDAKVTSSFVETHVRVGIASLREIIGGGRSVKHLRFE